MKDKEYEELHEKYESLLEELVRRIEKITELRIIIEKAITYCEESSKTIKSEYFSDVLKILKGEE